MAADRPRHRNRGGIHFQRSVERRARVDPLADPGDHAISELLALVRHPRVDLMADALPKQALLRLSRYDSGAVVAAAQQRLASGQVEAGAGCLAAAMAPQALRDKNWAYFGE